MPRLWERHRPVLLAGVAGVVPIGVYAGSRGDGRLVTYLLVLVTATFVVGAVDRRVPLPRSAVWALGIWAVAHLAGGMLPGRAPSPILYNTWLLKPALKYDQLVHAFGFGTSTLVSWHVLRARLGSTATVGGALIMAVLMGLGVGGANEIVEFLSVGGQPDDKVGDFANVGWDLVFDFAGGVVVAMWLWRSGATLEPDPGD